MTSNTIAQEIIILRSSKGWTQQQLADCLKTTQRTVAAWESGDSIPRNKMKVLLAKAFDLPEHYFLTEESEALEPSDNGQLDELMQKFDRLLKETGYAVSEDKKKMCLDSCYRILTDSKK